MYYTALDDKYIIGMLNKLFVLFFSFSVSQYRLCKTVSYHLGYCHAPYFDVVTTRKREDGWKKKPYLRFTEQWYS